jgi:hypothetical protein
MEGDQVAKILEANPVTKKNFRGCSPSDGLPSPSSLSYPAAFVVNLDPHNKKGSHWISIFAYGLNREVLYFDSLALPINENIEEQFLKAFPKTRWNSQSYQSPLSNTCAHYCICFIYYISQGSTYDQFLKLLDSKYDTDLFVREIVNKMIA